MKLSEVAKALGLAADAGEAKVREALGKIGELNSTLANSVEAANKLPEVSKALEAETAARKKAEEDLANERKRSDAITMAVVGEALRDGKLLLADKDKAVKLIANDAGHADKILRAEVKLHVANSQVSAGVAGRQGRENTDSDAAVANAHIAIQARAMKEGVSYEHAYFLMKRDGALFPAA
jgi:hypothetical protein